MKKIPEPTPVPSAPGWWKVLLADGSGFRQCSDKVRRDAPVRRRQCKKTATYALWNVSAQDWETPLCHMHFDHRDDPNRHEGWDR